MSSIMKTPEYPRAAYNLPEAAPPEAAAAEAAAGEAAGWAAADAGEAAAAAAVCRGEVAASARLEHFPITLTDAGRHGRV